MAKDSAKDSAKEATARAREMLLADRIPAFENLAAAQAEIGKIDERIERERAARAEALQAVRDRYDEALKAGWSASQLRELGYTAPRTRTTQRSRRTRSTKHSDGGSDSSSAETSSGEQQQSQTHSHVRDSSAVRADENEDTGQKQEAS